MSYSGGMGGGLLQIQQYEHSHMHTLGDISVKLRKQIHQNMKNLVCKLGHLMILFKSCEVEIDTLKSTLFFRFEQSSCQLR